MPFSPGRESMDEYERHRVMLDGALAHTLMVEAGRTTTLPRNVAAAERILKLSGEVSRLRHALSQLEDFGMLMLAVHPQLKSLVELGPVNLKTTVNQIAEVLGVARAT